MQRDENVVSVVNLQREVGRWVNWSLNLVGRAMVQH
jgi:hypothetical protein